MSEEIKIIKNSIKNYFKTLIDRKMYEINAVDCNSDIQHIIEEIEKNEREKHNREND